MLTYASSEQMETQAKHTIMGFDNEYITLYMFDVKGFTKTLQMFHNESEFNFFGEIMDFFFIIQQQSRTIFDS